MVVLYFSIIIIAFSAITFLMRLGTDKGLSPLGLSNIVSASSTLIILAAILVARKPLLFSLPAIIWAVTGGVCGITAFLLFIKAAQTGNYAYSVSIFQLSFLIPVSFSVIFWKEETGAAGIVGICLIILSLLLITSSSSGQNKTGTGGKWLFFAISSFFVNGVNGISQSMAARNGYDFLTYLFVVYLAGSILLFIFSAGRGILNKKTFLFGTGGAVCSLTGNFLNLKLLRIFSAGRVFPVTLTGPVMVSTMLSAFFFREKIRKLGYLGIALGIAGIALLSLK